MSEDKKKMNYYYGGKEKNARELRKQEEIEPYRASNIERDFNKLMNEFQRDFEDFWGTSTKFGKDMSRRARASLAPFTGVPSVDIEDQGKTYRLTVDLPGFRKEDVQIELTDDVVTINATRSKEENEEKKNFVRRERAAQTYYRRIPLPEAVRSDEANAKLNDGILEVTLPKKTPKETKKLTVT